MLGQFRILVLKIPQIVGQKQNPICSLIRLFRIIYVSASLYNYVMIFFQNEYVLSVYEKSNDLPAKITPEKIETKKE